MRYHDLRTHKYRPKQTAPAHTNSYSTLVYPRDLASPSLSNRTTSSSRHLYRTTKRQTRTNTLEQIQNISVLRHQIAGIAASRSAADVSNFIHPDPTRPAEKVYGESPNDALPKPSQSESYEAAPLPRRCVRAPGPKGREAPTPGETPPRMPSTASSSLPPTVTLFRGWFRPEAALVSAARTAAEGRAELGVIKDPSRPTAAPVLVVGTQPSSWLVKKIGRLVLHISQAARHAGFSLTNVQTWQSHGCVGVSIYRGEGASDISCGAGWKGVRIPGAR